MPEDAARTARIAAAHGPAGQRLRAPIVVGVEVQNLGARGHRRLRLRGELRRRARIGRVLTRVQRGPEQRLRHTARLASR